MSSRAISLDKIYRKKFNTLPFTGVWADVMGQPENNGAWIIYGAEKNGKTWFSLKLAEYLSTFSKTIYVSAEEGTGKTFVDACIRAGLSASNKSLQFMTYTPIDELDQKLSKRQAPKIMVFDNITIYSDELKNGVLRKFLKKHENKLLIFVAHEERKEPYTATAKLCKKLSEIIVRVEGLSCFVSGRCPGGVLNIDQEKAMLYHGTKINQNEQ